MLDETGRAAGILALNYSFEPEDLHSLTDLSQSLGYDQQEAKDIIDSVSSEVVFSFTGNTSQDEYILQCVHIPESRWGIMV